ncbi:MAG TPA: hypothetical protein VLF68_03930 [Candidatus Saccharimonadales bacterium]|nr:hypothetical protein [Candidatus Saccharimonadales bacterium]
MDRQSEELKDIQEKTQRIKDLGAVARERASHTLDPLIAATPPQEGPKIPDRPQRLPQIPDYALDGSPQGMIHGWDLGGGHVVYQYTDFRNPQPQPARPDQLRQIATAIATQRQQLQALSPEQRVQVENGYDYRKPTTANQKPYEYALRNDALARRVQEMQQNPRGL